MGRISDWLIDVEEKATSLVATACLISEDEANVIVRSEMESCEFNYDEFSYDRMMQMGKFVFALNNAQEKGA